MKSLGIYQALDATFELRADQHFAGILTEAYADLRTNAQDAPAESIVEVRHRRRQADDETLHAARRRVNDLAVASVVNTDTVVAAGVVTIHGVAVAFVGLGGAGKSTLTAACALRGHPYLADDVMAVTPDGMVRPYHRPLGLRRATAPLLGLTVPDGPYGLGYPLRMGDRATLADTAPLGLIVVMHRREDTTTCEPLAPPMTLVRLTGQALRTPGREGQMFRRLEALARRVPAVMLEHHDLHLAVDLVEAQVANVARV